MVERLEEEMSKVSLIPEKINTIPSPEANRQSGGAKVRRDKIEEAEDEVCVAV
jgi:hypothetical protein